MGSPEEAEQWIDSMERIFKLLGCNDQDKITLVEYQLEGNTMYWWRALKNTIFPAGTKMVWDEFVKVSTRKFFMSIRRIERLLNLSN